MRLIINKKQFLAGWTLAERSTGASGGSGGSSLSILSSVLIKAGYNETLLKATDIKTSITCAVGGVTIEEPGETVLPVKMVSELFKKAPGDSFILEAKDGRATIKAGKSKYNFACFPMKEFPNLPEASEAETFCRITAVELAKILEEGTIAASAGDDFPLYLSSAYFQIKHKRLSVASTDTRRLALSSAIVDECAEEAEALLPMKGVKELQRILASLERPEKDMAVLYSPSQFFFKTDGIEFTVRTVESKFPAYEKILPKEKTLEVEGDRNELMSAFERVDIVVRDGGRMVIADVIPEERMYLRGKAPDVGEAKEEVAVTAEGEKIRIAVNSKYFLEAFKVLRSQRVKLNFNGSGGHIVVKNSDNDDFLCLIAPINLPEEELKNYELEPEEPNGI